MIDAGKAGHCRAGNIFRGIVFFTKLVISCSGHSTLVGLALIYRPKSLRMPIEKLISERNVTHTETVHYVTQEV